MEPGLAGHARWRNGVRGALPSPQVTEAHGGGGAAKWAPVTQVSFSGMLCPSEKPGVQAGPARGVCAPGAAQTQGSGSQSCPRPAWALLHARPQTPGWPPPPQALGGWGRELGSEEDPCSVWRVGAGLSVSTPATLRPQPWQRRCAVNGRQHPTACPKPCAPSPPDTQHQSGQLWH